jgi:thiol-disulfide isomerase/thioredoxin
MPQKTLTTLLFVSFGVVAGLILQPMLFRQSPAAVSKFPNEKVAVKDQAAKDQVVVEDQSTRANESVDLPELVQGPRLHVEQPVYVFGQAERGTTVPHNFVLKNIGSEPLVIEKLKPSCGCTAAQLSDKTIPPGGQATLNVKLNLKLQKGHQDRTILVQTNDPKNENLQLRMVGEATTRASVTPDRVIFSPGQPPVAGLEIVAVDGLKFSVTGTRTSGTDLTAEVETIEEGKRFRVQVAYQGTPASSYKGWVHILTDNPGEYKVIGIPVGSGTAGKPAPVNTGVKNGPATPRKASAITVGQLLPVAGPTLDKKFVDSRTLAGRPKVVVFWASWCSACRSQMPSLLDIYRTTHSQGVEFIGVNMDRKTESAEKYVAEKNIEWPNIHFPPAKDSATARNEVAAAYQVHAIPQIVVVDGDGRVVSTTARGKALEQLLTRLTDEGVAAALP